MLRAAKLLSRRQDLRWKTVDWKSRLLSHIRTRTQLCAKLTFLFTELSMLLLKNECKWLRWSHFFEEEDTGDLDHKAIYNIISAIAEISIKAMPDLRRDELLRRWYSYTLRGT